jgi:hypothetical protein
MAVRIQLIQLADPITSPPSPHIVVAEEDQVVYGPHNEVIVPCLLYKRKNLLFERPLRLPHKLEVGKRIR